MGLPLTDTPPAERARQLHSRLSGDGAIGSNWNVASRPPREAPTMTAPGREAAIREAVAAGCDAADICLTLRMKPESLARFLYRRNIEVPGIEPLTGYPAVRQRALLDAVQAKMDAIRAGTDGERVPIPQRGEPVMLAGSAAAPSAPLDQPEGPTIAPAAPEVFTPVPGPANAPAATVDALESIQWVRPGRGHAERRTTVTVTEQSWYFSNAAAALIGSPERVRVGRTPTGVVVVAPGTDADPDSLRLIHKGKEGAGASLRAKCIEGLLSKGVYGVRCERGWLVVARTAATDQGGRFNGLS